MVRDFSLGDGRQYLQCGPAYHLAGAWGVVCGLHLGGQLVPAGDHDDPAVVFLHRRAAELQAGVCLGDGTVHRRLAVLRPVAYAAASGRLKGVPGAGCGDDDECQYHSCENYLSQKVPGQGSGA